MNCAGRQVDRDLQRPVARMPLPGKPRAKIPFPHLDDQTAFPFRQRNEIAGRNTKPRIGWNQARQRLESRRPVAGLWTVWAGLGLRLVVQRQFAVPDRPATDPDAAPRAGSRICWSISGSKMPMVCRAIFGLGRGNSAAPALASSDARVGPIARRRTENRNKCRWCSRLRNRLAVDDKFARQCFRRPSRPARAPAFRLVFRRSAGRIRRR